MCGIVGYVGARQSAASVILESLRRLEYRGYDSAGLAVGFAGGAALELRRASGKLRNLEDQLRARPVTESASSWGVGHTRWATHGRPSEENAHPHRDCSGRIVVVHNGIVENYLALKARLVARGHVFASQTDTEVISHLVEENQKEGVTLAEAVRRTVLELTGAFAIGVVSADEPGVVVAARVGPPLVVGLGEGESFLASDVPGILHQTRDFLLLEDGDMAVLQPDRVTVTDFHGRTVKREPVRILWEPVQAEKGGYKHFMLKEIFEQPRAIRDTVLGRVELEDGKVFLPEMDVTVEELRAAGRVHIAACGTSWHAAIVGKFMIEQLARLPVEVDYASEYRYRDPVAVPGSIGLLITQSGETADTLAAQKEMILKGFKTLAITNVAGSAVARAAQGVIYTHAGPEIGVASTKAFTAQLSALFVLAMYLGQVRGTISGDQGKELAGELALIPGKLEATLKSAEAVVEQLARTYSNARDFLYLGRGVHYPIALEGALKLKEISYIHAEGYPAGEMKHGPNALIDETLPVVALACRDARDAGSSIRFEKTLGNMQEVLARAGRVIAVVCEGDVAEVEGMVEHVVAVPAAPELLLPLLEVVPLQLLAYQIAVRRGCDVDQPRNLAKSVTVE